MEAVIDRNELMYMQVSNTYYTKENEDHCEVYRKDTHLSVGKQHTIKNKNGKKKTYTVINVPWPDGSKKVEKKARVIYMLNYGPIPEDRQIMHWDGDKENFELENLVCANQEQANALTLRQEGIA